MRVVLSVTALLALVAALAAADKAPQCQGLLSTRGGGFFSKLEDKITSVTKSGTDVSSLWLWRPCVGVDDRCLLRFGRGKKILF